MRTDKSTIVRAIVRILICAVIVAMLCVAGGLAVQKKSVVEEQQSSYTMTEFDYVIVSPSKEQISEFSANSEAVNSIMPCYNMNVTAYGKRSTRINLLLTESIENYDVGLFNDRLLTAGSYDPDGLMLDKEVAEKIGVGVGDNVTFSLGGKSFGIKVAAIYMKSTYKNLDGGVALARFTDEMKNAYDRELSYNLAFIDAKDISACDVMLEGYKPMGQIMSRDAYFAKYKGENNIPPNTTESEWDASIAVAYEEYVAKFESGKYEGVVQKKSEYIEDVKEQVETTENEIGGITVGVAVAAVVLYTVLSVIISLAARKDNMSRINDGEEKNEIFFKKLLAEIFSVAAISALSFAILYLLTSQSAFASASVGIVLVCALPIWGTLLITLPVAWISLPSGHKNGMKK